MLRPVDRTLTMLAAMLVAFPLAVLFADPGPSGGPLPPNAAAAVPAPVFGPMLPPDFYGKLPDPYPGPEAAEGVKRLALLYNGCVVGEIEACG